jgi:hypothetical protein
MDNSVSPFIRISEQDTTISQSNDLLLVLSDLVKNCDSCRNKLKIMKMVGRNHLPTQASQQDTQPTKNDHGEFNEKELNSFWHY